MASPIDPSKACANWRWIGIKRDPQAECPEIAGWGKGKRLFGEKDTTDPTLYKAATGPESGPELLAELNRFCVYENKQGSPRPPRPKRSTFVRLDKDCAAIVPSGRPSLEADTWEPLSAHFLSQAGRVETMPAVDGPPGVRLAFLDTQPEDINFREKSGNSKHGYTLAHIARNLVCGPGFKGGCAAKITTRLALPVVRFNRFTQEPTDFDTVQGGFFGSLTDLADAIVDEVDAWKAQDPTLPLVLNLSVAWDGKLFGGLQNRVDKMPAGVQAVYRALEYAAGHGALVLAAAGNRQYGPYPSPYPKSGPLLPAAWESRPRRTPLLYAVGGVQSEGWPLANARLGGMPRRVAYADHAVVDPLDFEVPTAVYTGSSVATAVVSSIAAAVWKAHPHLDAHGVMRILDASGDELKLKADFWFGAGSAPNVHRLSLCSALADAACRSTPSSGDCKAKFRCGWTRERPALSAVLATLSSRPVANFQTSGVYKAPSPCRSETLLRRGRLPWPPLCPSDRFFGITSQPWLFPQPGDPPCPSCLMTPPPPPSPLDSAPDASRSYTLHGVIRDTWQDGYCLDGATLDIEQLDQLGSATRRLSVDFGQSYCQAGQPFAHQIQIPSYVPLDETTTATLGFVIRKKDEETGDMSAQSPVLIVR